MRTSIWIRQHLAAFRALLVLTVITGIAYPLAVFAVAQLPGLHDKAEGSIVEVNGKTVGSTLIGQSFTDSSGTPRKQYFQSRPSAAGDGYDPTSTSASNLGPENLSLLNTVCARGLAIGKLESVDGSRPFCTADGVGAVLSVTPTKVVSVNEPCPATPFIDTYDGVKVECAVDGEDYSAGRIVPIRGNAPADPMVPADAVTASGSGLDPHISPAYAELQAKRVAAARGISVDQVRDAIRHNTQGRAFGFIGEPTVNVLLLNIELDRDYPYTPS
ncbi:potassium-transporting ATPase subunit C [Antrihabitans stalactiti]|uniref:Potassium-transporting ATPase KdpC subunit n=1 Tax=Antrihabitans stalactiti TaxID=2584121 RepID=A0A848KED3_9NOCA|nr:potassium-transporting ATPase subunit C [Antrihabitans stalactiti]NMN94357.1 potassium-transporting ATPase subunit C [Antrihabitans stalactiti]